MKQFTIQLDSKISITYTYIMKTDFAEKITVSNLEYLKKWFKELWK
jgi:hypothetical protein